jgi:hypothetical protein
MAIRNAIVGAIATGATPGEIERAIELAAAAGIPAVQMALPLPGGIGAPAGGCRGDAGVPTAAGPPVAIPAGQGELF